MLEARGRRLIAAALGVVVVAPWSVPPARAQLEALHETVEVRVVNVEVVATDRAGHWLSGLEREDFRLLIDGKEVPIEYFSAFEGTRASVVRGASGVAGAGEAVGAPGGQVSETGNLPLLIVDYDARFSRPGIARRALETLREQLGELLESTRAIMVARQGMSLVIEQPFTRDLDLLDAALGRLVERKVPSLGSADRQLLISRLERAIDPELAGLSEEDEGVLDTALDLLRQVRIQAEVERQAQRAAIAQLESLVASLAGLPGRKAILYLGPGIQPQPAEALYRIWWSKYRSISSGLGIVSIESEMGLEIAVARLTRLLGKANEAQVAFYGHDPRGVRGQGTVEFESIAASEFTESDTKSAQQWILSLARSTGGVGRVNSADLEGLVTEMMEGFRNYYSLGFSPGEAFPESGKVRVELVNKGGRVRHFDRYVIRTGKRGLEELTVAALLTEMAINPMGIQVEMEEPERQSDGTYLVSLLVKIPIASLTLVPQGARHVGRLSVVVQAQGAGGDLSEPATGVVAVELENEQLLTSLNGMAGYRLKMRVSKGEQRIAIGVRDEIAQRDSALRMVIKAGHDS